jgi:hypothetical protein
VTPLTQLGGAEIGIKSHIDHAPASTRIDVVLPSENPNVRDYDAVILGNLRPPGGVGEHQEIKWVEKWADLVRSFNGFSLKMEHDIHPCARRDARCISFNPIRKLPCECGPLIPSRIEELYNACTAVRFLSPSHQRVINSLVTIKSEQYVIAPPIDFSIFRSITPYEERKRKALIIGDKVRVADTAETRALSHGFPAERIEYLSVPYSEMPTIYNQYQAVVVDPFMFHAFGRVAVEAKACGCEVIASERVGAFSWEDPIEACRRSNKEHWGLLLRSIGGWRVWLTLLAGRFT